MSQQPLRPPTGGGQQQQQHQPRQHQNRQQPQIRQAVQVHPSSSIPHGYVPAYLPGSASLVEELDQRLLIVLRDGKHIVGTLASFDQFSNLVLLNAKERRMLPATASSSSLTPTSNASYFYTDIDLGGLYCVRGENMVLLGRYPTDGGVGQQLDWDEWQKLSEQQIQAGNKQAALEWDFDSDLIA